MSGKDGVYNQGEEYQGNGYEGSMPSVRNVVGMIEHDQALNLGAGQIATCRGAGLPSKHAKPACSVVNDDSEATTSYSDQSCS